MIRDHIIKRVNYKKKVLGLEIDDKLQQTKHVEEQSKKFLVRQLYLKQHYSTYLKQHYRRCTSHLYSPISTIAQLYGMMVIKRTPKKYLIANMTQFRRVMKMIHVLLLCDVIRDLYSNSWVSLYKYAVNLSGGQSQLY